VLSPQDAATFREHLARIAQLVDEHQEELAQLVQLRADLFATVREHAGITNDALGALAGISPQRAGELARKGRVITP
jgi:acyl-CoA reductase-like NAD-dependent aldehyde dehydrogenase